MRLKRDVPVVTVFFMTPPHRRENYFSLSIVPSLRFEFSPLYRCSVLFSVQLQHQRTARIMQPSTAARAAQSRKSRRLKLHKFGGFLPNPAAAALFPLLSRPPSSAFPLQKKTTKKSHSLRAPLLAAQLRRWRLFGKDRPRHVEGRGKVLLVGLQSLALGGRGGVVAKGAADREGVGRADVGRRRQGGDRGAARADPGGEETGVEAGWGGRGRRESGRGRRLEEESRDDGKLIFFVIFPFFFLVLL
jgi:hypothetical protein